MRTRRWVIRVLALGYLSALLFVPVAMIAVRTFQSGIGPVWAAITDPNTVHALWLTLQITLIAVPLNTIFGICAAIAIVRCEFRGKSLLNAFIALPFALSPVVVGLCLVLTYGRTGWFGSDLADQGIQVIFAMPGMVLATIFVSLPFVAREVIPVLREIGTEQEQAAATLGASGWQTFFRVTLPAIRWGVVYGVILTTARSIGEYGAVAVVSGRIIGVTETATIHVNSAYDSFDKVGAYSTALVLAVTALSTVLIMNLVNTRRGEG
jgi:sulfate transport system permease protein